VTAKDDAGLPFRRYTAWGTRLPAFPGLSTRSYSLILPVAAVCAITAFVFGAPDYAFERGFPLDDAWIHAVYARELARTATLAYNPGIPATGETAPLWPVLLAWIHWLTTSSVAVTALTKAVGLLIHLGAAAAFAVALKPAAPGRPLVRWAAAGLIVVHPDLLAASVSGMEVPLATLVIAAIVAATTRDSAIGVACGGAVAIVARPEVAVIAVLFPFLYWATERTRRACGLAAAAGLSALVTLLALGLRNRAVSGSLLPATFHAKAHAASPFAVGPQIAGFSDLFGCLTLFESVVAVLAVVAVSLTLLLRSADDRAARSGAVAWLSGLAFCAVSFALIPPVDGDAFYHQRYVLPALLLLVGSLPVMADALAARIAPRVRSLAVGCVAAVLAVVCIVSIPSRATRLANDASNVDDVQVAFGQALGGARPEQVVWAVDAGAVRYFGRTTVVDLIGLNTPELLGPGAQAYLDAHEPSFLDLFPGWSWVSNAGSTPFGAAAIQKDVLPARVFSTTMPYTVTSTPTMNRHVLVTCQPAGLRGQLVVRGRVLAFRCAP
jgi:hypothetical protein